MNHKQCKMARAGLGWRSQQLATKAGVSYPSLYRFESGKPLGDKTRNKLAAALEAAGVQFSDRSGRVGVTVPK